MNDINKLMAKIIAFLGILVCISFVVIFFIACLNATSTFQKLGHVAFSCFSLITAQVIGKHEHYPEDVAGLCYCNIMGFCMIFGVEIMTRSVLEGIICFTFGLMFFMVWLLTINAFLKKTPTYLGRAFL
ncbi:hypothetical protein [Candidatus Uabimicrobium amorphum]|uniref:Uncharacterized protein n=1 Tax=Uabimicrobium amorphum TaxID=2596890 RepID=A0A5S9F1W0_UABAM|nr:hypothetical protein [Candidatus Uabimicrobium amorphum]BBM82838.1 hypothetical protein UABAM_01181 [Candidatus Uabimicrobium amorphum]